MSATPKARTNCALNRAQADQPPSTLNELAALIGSGPPAPWLVAGLESSATFLKTTIAGEAAWPRREELRAKFTALAEAARETERLLADPALRHILSFRRAPKRALSLDWQMRVQMRWMSACAMREARAIRSGKGRDIHVPIGGGLSAREICAAIVAVAWRRARGEEVRHTSGDAQQACAALWKIAGGIDRSWGNTPAGWRQHLEKAKQAADLGAIEMRFLRPCG
jgi:hypothetical protein